MYICVYINIYIDIYIYLYTYINMHIIILSYLFIIIIIIMIDNLYGYGINTSGTCALIHNIINTNGDAQIIMKTKKEVILIFHSLRVFIEFEFILSIFANVAWN